MRIFISEICQETNSFCPELTDLEFFKRGFLLERGAIRGGLRGTATEVNGFFEALEKNNDVEIIPGIAAWAVTYGIVTAETFAFLVARLLALIEEAGPLDGVLLAMHGSMAAEGIDDCEGYILEQVRKKVGVHPAIVGTLDFHALLTPVMVGHADALVGFRTYPHTDHQQTGERAAECIMELIRKGIRPIKTYKRLPMICDPENTDPTTGVMHDAFALLKKAEAGSSLLTASLFTSHPWIDNPDACFSIVLYADSENKKPAMDQAAIAIMGMIWNRRKEFLMEYPSIWDFLARVSDYAKPVMLVDSGDVTTAGGMGDSTEVLRALVESRSRLKTTLFMVDRETVQQAVSLGEGKKGWFDISGIRDLGYNKKIRILAEVRTIKKDAVYAKGPALTGTRLDTGTRVLLVCKSCLANPDSPEAGYIKIIVCEYSTFFHDPELLRNMGIHPEHEEIIVQKTHKLYLPAYRPILGSIVIADTRGVTDRNFKEMVFHRIRRPIWPLDDILDPKPLY